MPRSEHLLELGFGRETLARGLALDLRATPLQLRPDPGPIDEHSALPQDLGQEQWRRKSVGQFRELHAGTEPLGQPTRQRPQVPALAKGDEKVDIAGDSLLAPSL